MHTVYLESQCDGEAPPPPLFRWLLTAMYVLAPLVGVYVVAAIFELVPRPEPFGALDRHRDRRPVHAHQHLLRRR